MVTLPFDTQQNAPPCDPKSVATSHEQRKQPKCEHQHESEPYCAAAYRNRYEHCGTVWSDEWSCMCNDRCPICNAEIEPSHSEELAPCACAHLG